MRSDGGGSLIGYCGARQYNKYKYKTDFRALAYFRSDGGRSLNGYYGVR